MNKTFFGEIEQQKVFCCFEILTKPDGKKAKQPYDISGKRGIGRNSIPMLGTYEEVRKARPPYIGISMIKPVHVGALTLVCLDLDWKQSPNKQPHATQQVLIDYAIANDLAMEDSFSGLGAHIWVLCAEGKVPLRIDLTDKCEVEVFSGDAGQACNVLLTMDNARGTLKEVDLNSVGVFKFSKPRAEKTQVTRVIQEGEIKRMLEVLDPSEYETWLKVGMALKTEYGDAGFNIWDQWSQLADNYSSDTPYKWDTFTEETKDGVTMGSVLYMAKEKGYVPADRYQRNKHGQITPTFMNMEIFFSHEELYYDTFFGIEMINDAGLLRPIKESDTIRMCVKLESTGFINVQDRRVNSMMHDRCANNMIDKAYEWGKSLKWDGIDRCTKLFSTYFGAEDNEYTRAASLYFACAMGGRLLAKDQGYKADMVPVLMGPQGCGKTTAVAALAPITDSFSDLDLSAKDADISRALRGKLIIEMGELKGLRKKEHNHIKAWITKLHEVWIPKFKEKETSFNRRCVFVATTNETEFLTDDTGHRRWLPIKVTKCHSDLIEVDREQIWAQAVALHLAHGSLHIQAQLLAPEFHKQAEVKHEILDGLILDAVDELFKQGGDVVFGGKGFQTKTLYQVLGTKSEAMNLLRFQPEVTLKTALSRLGFEYKNVRLSKVPDRQAKIWRKSMEDTSE
jgi:Virulence-associated protein E/Primase C terminal 2 (PriCT-2)